jgi:ABC-2 type transport system permease protein
MSKILLIAIREITTKVKSFWFWVGALLVPFGFLITILITIAVGYFNQSSSIQTPLSIQVFDQTNLIVSKIESNKTQLLSNKSIKIVKSEFANIEEAKNKLKNESDNKNAILFIPLNYFENIENLQISKPKIEIFSAKSISNGDIKEVESLINPLVKEIKLKKLNLNPQIFDTVNKSVKIENIQVNNRENKRNNSDLAYGISYFLSFIIYLVSIIFGSSIMMSILEEKNSRVVEVLISAVTPIQLLSGKILGQICLILIQTVTIITSSSLLLIISTIIAGSIFGLNNPNPSTINNIQQSSQIPYGFNIDSLTQTVQNTITQAWNTIGINPYLFFLLILFFFIQGLLMQALWFAAIGASSNDYKTASNSGLSFAVSMPSIFAIVFINQIIEQPNGILARVLSFIPFTSFTIMPARLMFGINPWEIFFSMIISILGLIFSFYICAKIYRTGLLLYGKTANLKEIWTWLRQS